MSAAIELDFVDTIPQAKRGTQSRTASTRAGDGRPFKVTETGDRYVAPASNREHGTKAKYVAEKCRCLDCTVAAREYNKTFRRAVARPDEAWVAYVPALRARRHLLDLQRNGVGYKTVANIAGLAESTVGKILWPNRYRGMGPSRRVRPVTEAKILAVTLDQVDGAQRIPGGPTWELLDDLLAQGFYRTWIARQIIHPDARALQIHRDTVRASTARKVEQLHREWSGRTPPAKKTRHHQ